MKTSSQYLVMLLLAVISLGVFVPPPLSSQEPAPSPPVTPQQGEAHAVITDKNGNPLPEEVPAGEVVFFSAKGSKFGDKPKSVLWMVDPPARMERSSSFRTSEFGPLLVVPTGTSTTSIKVTLFVSLGDTGDVAQTTIKIVGANPTPGPDVPTPPTPPKPPTGLKSKLSAAFQKAPPPAASHAEVAKAFRDSAADLKAGAIQDLDGLLKITTDRMTAAVGFNEFINWVSWRNTISDALSAENIPVAGHVEAWNLIADLLEGK